MKFVYFWANVIANILSTAINEVNKQEKLYGKKLKNEKASLAIKGELPQLPW